MRLLVDAYLSPVVAEHLRQAGHDLPAVEEDLVAGSVVSIRPGRLRVRRLPLA